MSLKLNERYPGRYNNPSADYPQGSFKNRTTPTAKDGSYLERDWANDKEGFFQRLISQAGITPNGLVDTAQSSQYYTALTSIIAAAISAIQIPLPPGSFNGFSMANNAVAPNTTVDVGPGDARSSDNTVDIRLNSTLRGILQSSGAWTAGDNQNKLDVGAKAINSTYHKFVIGHPTLADDILYSLSPDAPTIPSGYAGFRRVGRVATDASGNIRGFKDRGNGEFEWTTLSVETNKAGIAPGTSLLSLSGMGGAPVSARIQVLVSGDASVLRVLSTDQTDNATSIPQSNWNGGLVANNDTTGTDGPNTCEFVVSVSTSGQVRLRYTAATGTLNYRILVIGWRESR